MSQEVNHSQPHHEGGHPQGGKRAASPSHGEEGARRSQPRRRRRRRLGILGALLYVVVVLAVSALLATAAWAWANDVLALNKEPLTAVVEISEGDTISDVADQLEEKGLIEYKLIFRLFCVLTHAEGDPEQDIKPKITPGTYELNTDMDYRALISNMGETSRSRKITTVTITEGMTLDQIFALLEERGVATAESLSETAASHDFKYSFLKGVIPLGDAHRLEGYLFPDTYDFYMGEEPVSVLNKMILRFDEIFNDELRQAMADKGMTIQDAVTIASMIEKETDGTDQGHIASVIYNRLLSPTSETAGYLNIDAAILYATGGSVVDVNADTPYNTHTHTGLPPTAISSPGRTALRAAVYPDSTKDYFYALGDDGVHHFFRTYGEQQSFIATQARYQNG